MILQHICCAATYPYPYYYSYPCPYYYPYYHPYPNPYPCPYPVVMRRVLRPLDLPPAVSLGSMPIWHNPLFRDEKGLT